MFTRAGTSHRFRIVCYGFIPYYGRRPACLLRFVESGEYVWALSLKTMFWPEQVIRIWPIVSRPAGQARDACPLGPRGRHPSPSGEEGTLGIGSPAAGALFD